ncbi:hypothetical protein [Endozoicomonas sp. ALD068]|uniref:hypothetical protein n=2 Tax=unclassified Endozoicomonas TaxID=2644528 RepID=UPI003BB6936E
MPSITNKVHVAIVDAIEGWERIWLAIWAWANPNHDIYVWAPKALIYKRILYSLLYSERMQQTIETDYPADIARLRRSIWQKIDTFMGENVDVERLDIMKADFSDSVKRSFTTQWNKTINVLNQIQNSISRAYVRGDTSAFERQHSEYIKYTLSLKKTVITARTIGFSHLFSDGGVYFDKGLLPALRLAPFEKQGISHAPVSEGGLDSSEREQLERAKIHAIVQHMFKRGIIPDPDRFFNTDDINLPQEQLNRIRAAVEITNISDLFHRLSNRQNMKWASNSKIFFGRTIPPKDEIRAGHLDDSVKPMMVEAFPNNPLINKVIQEATFFHSVLEKFKNNNEISKERRVTEINKTLNEFFKYEDPADNKKINGIAIMLAELSYNNGDLDHRILAKLGYDAFERIESTDYGEEPLISRVKSFSEQNPFYSMNSDSDLPDPAHRRPYDKFIMINMPPTKDDGKSARQSYGKYYRFRTPADKNVLYDFFYSVKRQRLVIKTILGTPFKNIGEDTKVFITGSLDFPDIESDNIYSIHSLSLVQRLSIILRTVIPENTTVQNIAFSFDNSAQGIPDSEGVLDAGQKGYIVPEVLRELAKKGIRANSAVAVRGYLSAGVPRQTTGGDPNRPSTSRDAPDPELNRIVFTRNEDDTVTYIAKFGLDSLDPDKEFHPRPDIKTPESMFADQLFESVVAENSQRSTDPRLVTDSAAALVEMLYAGDRHQDGSDSAGSENRVPTSTGRREFIDNRKDASKYSYYTDFQAAIYFGLVQQPPTENAAFIHPHETETRRLRETLQMAMQSSSYTEWLARYERRFTNDHMNQLEREIEHFKSNEAKAKAFENIKNQVQKGSYYIHNVDIETPKGAAEINAEFKNDFDNVHVLPVPPQGACRRPRRSAGAGSCDARRKNLEYALRLLSGFKTQLRLGNDRKKTDIALIKPANEDERWLQNFFTRFRRLEGKDALAHARGMHSVIALDEDSFTRAQQQIKDGTLSGQPLLLKATPAAGYVLLTPDGRVQSAIAGGDGNRVTVLGRPARLIAHALTTLVDFTPDRYIATLTVSDLASSNQSRGITALNALKTFMTRSPTHGKPLVGKLIVEPRSGSPQVFKRLVKDIQHLMPKDRPAIESLVLRSPGTGQPEYRLLPGEKTVLRSPRSLDSNPPLRYLPPSHLSVPVPPRTEDSLSSVASERAEFRQRLLEFDTALGDIKARHSLADSMAPQLDTLRRDGRGWRMDFMEPDTLTRKNIRFTSGAFDRFRGFLQGTGRQGFRVKGKKSSTNGLEKLRSFIGLYDLIAGLSPVGHHYKNPPSQNMTDTQQQIYTGRQTLFYTAVALQGIEIINLGRQGIKTIIPAIRSSLPPGQKPPKLPDISGSGKLPGGLKKVGRLGKKVGRFVPILGLAVPGASLTLTLIEYENEEDPEVKKLMESMVTFEWVDTYVSVISEFLGPVGAFIDGIMHYVRGIFQENYKRKLKKLAYKKLQDASGEAAKIFDLIHAQLDPKSFLANKQTLNALMSEDGKSLLPLNIRSINLANQTLTYGGVYSFKPTLIAGKKDDWKQKNCEKIPYVPKAPLRHCASDINRIEYSPDTFNLIDDALATLCRTESRLTGYQCSDGVFRNLGQMSDKKVILMPSVPPWEVKLLYSPLDQTSLGSAPDSSSPGAKLLDAVSDSKLKRLYQKKVKDTRYTECDGHGSCDDISYDYKYLGQMFTHTDSLKYRRSTSRLYLDNKDHVVVFREVSSTFSRLLKYDVYSPEGANKTYALISNGEHTIHLHPQGQTASTWVLNYDGKLPYACITERDDQVQNCRSWVSLSYEDNRDFKLGETLFRFPEPRPHSWYEQAPSYKVVARDPNAQFEWRLLDHKVIQRLYDNGGLNDGPSRASKLNRIMSRYTAASRFLPLELKDCDFSPQIRARCMDGAPNRWTTTTSGWSPKIPNRWEMNGALDPLPKSNNRQNPAWLQHQRDCDRQVNEYLKKPYRCFPGKLGLAEADWDQLGRVLLWYDTLKHQEIRLIAASAQVQPVQLQPVQGNPATGYYFFDSANGQVLFQNKEALTREIRHFDELSARSFGHHVSKIVPNKDESQLLVFDAPYYYLLTASPSGQLAHQVIAAETLDGQLSVPPTPPAVASDTTTSDHGLIPLQDVDSYGSRRLLRTGFYDDTTRSYITFLSSLLDGDMPNNRNDGSRLRTINERVRRALREEHLPVHKVVVRGQTVYYILFSRHSGKLYYFSTDVNRPGGIQRLNSGFHLIRPAGEKRALEKAEVKAKIARVGVFRHVQAHSGSLLADTNGGYRLWIPDKAWDNTRVVSENLSVESGPFKNWQVEATGQIVAKSNDTLSVHQFTPQSGLMVDSLNLGKVVNLIFAKLTIEHPGTAWTTTSARFFIRELKSLLRDRLKGAREGFSAKVGLVPLRPITAIIDHPLFSAIRQLDVWYYPDSDTLLAANTGDQFEVMVNDDGQLLALSDTRKEEAFEFFRQPDQGAKGHPFCGEAAAASLTGMPSEFDDQISVPCRYMAKRIDLRGSHHWEHGARAWRIQTPTAQYLANREHLALVALDLSLIGPRNTTGRLVYWTRQDFNQAMGSLPAGIRQKADTELIALTLRSGYSPTQVAWMDYQGQSPRKQRLLFGLPGKEHGVQQVIGSVRKFSLPPSTSTVVYNRNNQTLYRVTQKGYQSLGTFGRVAVMAEGLLLSGTPGADKIKLETLRLDTYYQEHRVAFVRNGTRQRFGIMVESQGGSDVIKLDETDLSFFARILIHPGLAEESITKHDRAQTRIELNVSAFLFLAWRRGQNLVLSNRFTTGDAEIEIQQVWARQHDQFLQPTTLVFNDLELSLSDLAARVTDSGQGVVLPLTVSSLVRKERLRFINATASNPLYIQQDQPVKIVTYQAMDGIKLTVEPLNATYVRRQVFITGTGQWGWEPGSVQVNGPKPDSGYQSWPFLPSVISSSAVGNRTARLWGNSRSNILYLGADARQWSLRGWGGHDLLLLGTSGNIAARPEVLANRGDQCDNRRLDTPGNSSLWQAILDWTRPLVGGVGNDVYDLRACRPARTIDSHGKHYVLLSSGSKADLRRLSGDNSTALFFTDLTPGQVAFSQCNPQVQSNLTRSSNFTRSSASLPLESQTFRIINTGTNQTLALVKPEVLASLHFKGGQVSLNPMAMINRNDSKLAMNDSDGGENEAVTFLNKIIRRGQRLVNYLCSLAGGEKNNIGSESERPVGTSLNNTELYQHYQRLVQDLSALSGNYSVESPSFIPSANRGTIQSLTTPQPLATIGQS